MRFYSIFIKHISRRIFPAALVAAAIFFIGQTTSAQCVSSSDGETAVRMQNDSSFLLFFYIDGVKKAVVPVDQKSDYFAVTPGEHVLNAEAIVGGVSFVITFTPDVPKGHLCTWTIVDPDDKKGKKRDNEFRISLLRK